MSCFSQLFVTVLKLPDKNNLEKETFIWGSHFQRCQSTESQFLSSESDLRQKPMAGESSQEADRERGNGHREDRPFRPCP